MFTKEFFSNDNCYALMVVPSKEIENHLRVSVTINMLRPDFVTCTVDIPVSEADTIHEKVVPLLERLCIQSFKKGITNDLAEGI
jgi:hypothetical protein